MTLELHRNKILELMKELELLMATIYQQMAQRFPDHADSYQSLANEEMEHAGWIEQLQTACQSGQARFAEGKTRTYTVNNMISYLKDFLQKLEAGHLNRLQTMTVVADFENSLIERNVFQRFSGDTPEVAQTLELLEQVQRQHTTRINALLLQVRNDHISQQQGP